MNIDIAILLVYFAFLIGLGWIFRSTATNTSEYFHGGGKMLVMGSSALMMALSAVTFTGLMGKALSGMSVAIEFFANSLGYFVQPYSKTEMIRGETVSVYEWSNICWGTKLTGRLPSNI